VGETIIRRSLAAFAIVAACALATPMAATAGTYSFALSEPSIALGAFEQNHDGVYRFVEPTTITAQTDGTPYTAGDYERAWLALPGGAAFTQLGGLVSLGSLNVSTGGSLTGSIVVRTSTGSVSTAWSHAITPTYPAYAWAYDGTTTRPSSVGVQLAATVSGVCGTCGTEMTALYGVIDDSQPPSSVSISSPLAGKATINPGVAISWSVTDGTSGPGNVYLEINGQRQLTPLRIAPAADTSRLILQKSGGLATITGSSPVTLPDQDGIYTLQVIGDDAVGNETTSDPIEVSLDRQAPTVDATAPTGWCTHPCPVSIHATDAVTGLASIQASMGGVPVPLSQPVGGHSQIWSVDASTLAIEGQTDLHLAVTDGAGNERDQDVPLQIDTTEPTFSAAAADPLTRTVTIDVAATSGVAAASLQIGKQFLDLRPVGAAHSGVQTLGATVPTAGFPATLDGTQAAISAADQAGNRATTTIGFRTRQTPAFRAGVAAHSIRAGSRVRLSGRITGSDLPSRVPLVIMLANPNWPSYHRTWHVNTIAGRFSIGLTPPISGTLTVSYDGSTVVRAATVSVGHVAVTPRITATFRRSHGSIIAKGSFSPTDGPSATLLWQAKSPRGGGWLNICPDHDAIHVRHGGFTGHCHLTLNPGLQLRLVYRPGVGGAYGPAASPGRSAR
jgi:hypothetical protein